MTERETPMVWIGCLACYNAGRLVGEWFDADEAGDVTPEQLHGRPTHHEELWVMDHEGFGGLLKGECSPVEAQRIAEQIAELPDYVSVEAFAEYAELVTDPTVEGFEDSYCGHWDSEVEYAQDFADGIGAVNKDVGWPYSHIDWERAARELLLDYHVVPASGGGYHFFHM